MFASSSKGAYICLRCRSKAVERLSLPSLHAAQKRTVGARRTITTRTSRGPDSRRERTIYPHGKLRGKIGGEVRELTERLPQDALGKPAEIIVLKDAGLEWTEAKPRESQESEVSEPKKSSQDTILSALAEQEATVDHENGFTAALVEVRSRALHAADLSYGVLSQEAHDAISKELHDGFTQKQLYSYLTSLLKEESRGQHDERQGATDGLPVRPAWTAGTVDARKVHGVRQLQRIIYQSKKRSKLVLASLIMDAWGIRSGIADQMGEIHLPIADNISGVNDEHGNSIVAEIASRYQVAIQCTSDGVQIRGEREPSEQAADEILRQVNHEIFKLEMKLWNPRFKKMKGSADAHGTGVRSKKQSPAQDAVGEFSQTTIEAGYLSSEATREVNGKDLDTISTMIGAVIKFDDQKTQIRITGRSPAQIADAQRALFTISELPNRSSSASRVPLENRRVVHDINLPYKDSGEVLTRAVCDVRLEPDHGQLPSGAQGVALRESHIQAVRILESATTLNLLDPKHEMHWSTEQQARLSTRLGQLYDSALVHSHRGSEKRSLQGLAQSERKWSPCLVHVPTLIAYLGLDHAKLTPAKRNIVSFAFRHDISAAARSTGQDKPNAQSRKDTTAPRPIPEVRFDFDIGQVAGERPSLLSVHAIVEDASMMIAYPDRPLDLSLSWLQTCVFKHANYAPAEDAIMEMTNSIMSDSRLRGPSTLEIPVPSSWTRRYPELPAFATSPPETDAHFKTATFRFVGVEHRQLIDFPWGPRHMQIVSVDAGKLGGRSLELLSLEDSPPLNLLLADPAGAKAALRDMYARALQNGEQLLELVDRAARGSLSWSERSAWAEDPAYRGGPSALLARDQDEDQDQDQDQDRELGKGMPRRDLAVEQESDRYGNETVAALG